MQPAQGATACWQHSVQHRTTHTRTLGAPYTNLVSGVTCSWSAGDCCAGIASQWNSAECRQALMPLAVNSQRSDLSALTVRAATPRALVGMQTVSAQALVFLMKSDTGHTGLQTHPSLEQTTRKSPMNTHHSGCVKQCSATGVRLSPHRPTPKLCGQPTHCEPASRLAIHPQPRCVASQHSCQAPNNGLNPC